MNKIRTEIVTNKKDISSNLYSVATAAAAAAAAAFDLYANYMAITDSRVVSKFYANSILHLNVVNVDHVFWKEERDNRTIITDNLNHEINSSQRILDVNSTNISNYGEIILLPFNLVYRVEQSDEEEEP